MHYAALDASILIDIVNTLKIEAEIESLPPISDFIETLDDMYFEQKDIEKMPKKKKKHQKKGKGGGYTG